jgi:hypothetical protein
LSKSCSILFATRRHIRKQQVEPAGKARGANEAVPNPEENLQPLKPAEESEADPFIAFAGEAPVQRLFHPKSMAALVQGIKELSESGSVRTMEQMCAGQQIAKMLQATTVSPQTRR